MRERPDDVSEAARKLAQRGSKKGGRARASVLTSEERREIAQKAARARWARDGEAVTPKATPAQKTTTETPHSMFRGTLTFGDVAMECHVLNDHRRVLTQREVVRVISGGRESGNLSRYLQRIPLYEERLLDGRTIEFRPLGGSGATEVAVGYEATHLVEICDSYLRARDEGLLKPSQLKLAQMAEIVVRACAKVGIIALIDEATGYQQVRQKQALRIKLQAFIAEDMQEWARMFPDDFWYELARLEGVRYHPRSRPIRWGKYVMAFVYDAIDPEVGKELRRINPNPHHRKNHHQWLKDFGRDKVNNQIQQVIAIMKLCDDMDDFRRKFDRVFKNVSYEQLAFDFDAL